VSSTGLAVTVHDPDRRLLERFQPGLGEIDALYVAKAAACTESTAFETVSALQEAGFRVRISPEGRTGQARRDTVGALILDDGFEMVHYADLDRLLHWHYAFPNELQATLDATPASQYVALGRTERAWETHPQVQVLAEKLTNQAFASALGIEGETDLVAGSALLSRNAAETLVRHSIELTGATDLEWPALVIRELGDFPEFRQVEGLEFETPDYFVQEIEAAGGVAEWIQKTYSRPEVWATRTKLALDSINALRRVFGVLFPTAPVAGQREDPV
jgi:hypothetical protein